jgi:hypothetical protein
VAIIDSGIARTPEIGSSLVAEYDMAVKPGRPAFRPRYDHGTMVATILLREAKRPIEIVSFRIDDLAGCPEGSHPPCQRDVGPIEVAAFNVGANVPASILEETPRKYFKIWEMACFGGFLMGREVARRMVPRGRGTILYTGATASIRGREHFAIDIHFVSRDSTPVIDDADGVVEMDGDVDAIGESRERFVNRVVYHFVDEVVQSHFTG